MKVYVVTYEGHDGRGGGFSSISKIFDTKEDAKKYALEMTKTCQDTDTYYDWEEYDVY